MQGICRLLGRPCDHSQRSGLLQTSKPPEKAADGNVPHVRRLQRFQNPYDDDARAHGTQVWSYGRTSEQPFCAQKSASCGKTFRPHFVFVWFRESNEI